MNFNNTRFSNGNFYKDSGNYRPGSISREIESDPKGLAKQERMQKTTNKILDDYSEYSKVIYAFINKEMEKGCSKEEAIKKVANNERVQARLYSYQKWKEKMQQKIFSIEDIVAKSYNNQQRVNQLEKENIEK